MDIIFYERLISGEIMAGNYFVKNVPAAHEFLLEWSNYEFSQPEAPVFSNFDNGALHIHVISSLFPEKLEIILKLRELWSNLFPDTEYGDYVNFAMTFLKEEKSKIRSPKLGIKIFSRYQGWAKDLEWSGHNFTVFDFMNHGIKSPNRGSFESKVTFSEKRCSAPSWFPPTETKFISEAKMKEFIEQANAAAKRLAPKAQHSSVETDICWPRCENVLEVV